MNKKTLFSIIFVVMLLAAAGAFYLSSKNNQPGAKPQILNFEDCAASGQPVAESYPRQCRTPDGRMFVENIGNELEKTDLIQIENPRPNQTISSPLEIKGQAKGIWYFEASFPARLLDANGKQIAVIPVMAQGEWMTENFVPFKAVLTFPAPETETGTLILEKDNPSGLPENADQLIIPVRFAKNVAAK